MKPDYFKDNAKDWDKKNVRVNNARNISAKILEKISLNGNEHLMDFGAGTGLLSEGIAQYVKKISAVDYSGAMLEQFTAKNWPCETDALNIDLTQATLDYHFDGIISSMTLHHIEDIEALFKKFSDLLEKGGFVALGDLSKEDGTFHSSNESVKHLGFDELFIEVALFKNNFRDIAFTRANVITKEIEGKQKDFPIFLVTAFKK